jgi:hypothetical protein
MRTLEVGATCLFAAFGAVSFVMGVAEVTSWICGRPPVIEVLRARGTKGGKPSADAGGTGDRI